ncbi:MAG: VTT domain-containing protein [Candidatus Zixiibacteriota bacterium]|nr:MAG: VTT domain-containing protein [candidate division Zixibacteria bacterium]
MPEIRTDRLFPEADRPAPAIGRKDIVEAKILNGGYLSLLVTIGIVVAGITIVAVFREDIGSYGMKLIKHYGYRWIDVILFALTAISASPICLPIWQYILVGIAMGYHVVRLAVVMALGSAVGSQITYYFGKYCGNTRFVKKRFPNASEHPWIAGRSRQYVSLLLFLGTASPIPFDILYFACGIKSYPPHLLYVINVSARFVRYLYLGYGLHFLSSRF